MHKQTLNKPPGKVTRRYGALFPARVLVSSVARGTMKSQRAGKKKVNSFTACHMTRDRAIESTAPNNRCEGEANIYKLIPRFRATLRKSAELPSLCPVNGSRSPGTTISFSFLLVAILVANSELYSCLWRGKELICAAAGRRSNVTDERTEYSRIREWRREERAGTGIPSAMSAELNTHAAT